MVKSNKTHKATKIPKTRKEIRKGKRTQKKIFKNQFFSKTKNNPFGSCRTFQKVKNNFIINKECDDEINSDFDLSDNEINIKFNSAELEKTKTKKQQSSNETLEADRFLEIQKREKKKQTELEKKMRKQRIIQLQEANKDEDKIIRKLEKKLKIVKERNEKSVHKMFNDGLDYALELCIPENIVNMYSAAKHTLQLNEGSDSNFQEDLAMALNEDNKKAVIKQSDIESFNQVEENSNLSKQKNLKKIASKYLSNFEPDLSGTNLELDTKSRRDSNIQKCNDKVHNSENSNDDDPQTVENCYHNDADQKFEKYKHKLNNKRSIQNMKSGDYEFENLEEDESKSNHPKKNKHASPDIYGRTHDADGNIIELNNEIYLPPHLRARLETGSSSNQKRKENLERLRKQCKGFLNRLSETNMHKISSDISNLYVNHPRFDVNNTISELILNACVAKELANDRMILEHAMLIAILHANVGNEVGAYFLGTLIHQFVKYVESIDILDVENKELDNIVLILAHLYTFKIFPHSLIFQIINKIIDKLCEKSVECLLLLLRTIGFQLRKDDPTGLKDLLLSIQKKSNNPELNLKDSPRFKFMLEILNAVKNNNMHKIPQYNPQLAEHLKKILKSMLSNGKYIITLNITLEDLIKANEVGKWWIVGSAWSGNIKDIGSTKKENDNKNEKFSEKLLELAKTQRMNTSDRRRVFCIIMSAEDYIDAFERLLHLSLKNERIISSIIIHCCLSEKSYNPYYSALAQKFCDYDRKYQLAIQFAIWDRIKDIHSASEQQIKNLSQFLIFLIVKGIQPISILKVIEFSELDRITLRLLRQIFLGILLGKKAECQQVFKRIAPSMKLINFKDSIKLFMHHFLLKGTNTSDISNEELELLQQRIDLADRILLNADLELRF